MRRHKGHVVYHSILPALHQPGDEWLPESNRITWGPSAAQSNFLLRSGNSVPKERGLIC